MTGQDTRDPRRIFVSRAGANAEHAPWIVKTLEEDGYTCVVQGRDFTYGDNFVAAMNEALATCGTVLAVLSPDYAASPYCVDEWEVGYRRHRAGEGKFLPVRVGVGKIPPLQEAVAYLDLVGGDPEQNAGRLRDAARRLIDGGEWLEASLTPAETIPTNSTFYTPYFTGREDELAAVAEALRGGNHAAALTPPAAVHGEGGVGKSAIAREFARRNLSQYAAAWLVRAEQDTTLKTDLGLLGERLNPQLKDNTDADAKAQSALKEAHELALRDGLPVLIILDNLPAERDLPDWITGMGGVHVLITTRYRGFAGEVTPVEITTLPPEAAKSLLMRISGRAASADMDRPVAELDGLALAITQAGAYLRQKPRTTVAAYASDAAKLVATPPPGWKRDEMIVAATHEPSIRAAEEEAPIARAVLVQASVFAPDRLPEVLLSDAEEDSDLEDALDALERYSMIRNDGEDDHHGRLIGFHRLLGAVVRLEIPDAELEFAVKAAARRLAGRFEGNPGDVRTWGVNAPLVPHVQALAEVTPEEHEGFELADALGWADQFFDARAQYGEAIKVSKRALAIDERLRSEGDPKIAIRLNNLAGLLQATHRLAEAERLYRRALAIDEASFGPDHPNVATNLNNLAELLRSTNRLEEAEPFYRRALAIDEASYGPDHPAVAYDLNNLALLLQATNRLAEAEPLMRRVISIFEASYGAEHPNVATALNNLAQLLKSTNRLEEAEPLYRRALAIDEASYGPDHPNVARELNNLAQLLQATDRLEEAEPLVSRVSDIFEASYGAFHPQTGIAWVNHGVLLLLQMGRAQEGVARIVTGAANLEVSSLPDGHPWLEGARSLMAKLREAGWLG